MATVGDISDLDELLFGGNPFLPDAGSYSVSIQGGVISSTGQGGLSKQQLQFYNSPYSVKVSYSGTQFEMGYLENFFNKNRGQRFVAHLDIGGTGIEPFVVQVTNRPSVSKTGFTGSVSITYEVEPATDKCYQESMLELAVCIGDPTELFCYSNLGVKAWPTATN